MAGSGNTVVHSPKGWFAVISRRAAFVAGSDQFEQHAGLGLILGDIGEIIEDQQVELVELVDGAASDSACRSACRRCTRSVVRMNSTR